MPVKVPYTLVQATRDKSFAEFLKENVLEIVVSERRNRFFAVFSPLVAIDWPSFKEVSGKCAETPDEAVRKLADEIRGTTLRIWGTDVTCPEHWREV